MLFSSITFLYAFLPVVFLLYFLVPTKLKNFVLLVMSLLFYAWGEPIYVFLMLGASLSGYIHGILIGRAKSKAWSKAFMISSVVVGLGLLGFFKYTGFFVSNVNSIFGAALEIPKIALPIGISFYTFQILSYTIDVYRGNAKIQYNFISFAAYVALFPQLIAGPIVRYTDVEAELNERKTTFDGFGKGVTRFIIGLGKKILLANTLGELCKIYKGIGENDSVLFTWVYVIAYALHIYFDFSGYSDMAIGLGKMFGFKFPENFNYPYISKTVSEFWRRWHMTLGSIFRDYVYIPMGGNRVGMFRWLINVFVVWFLTGFWHGAGWNFIAWGVMFGILLAVEKLFMAKILDKLPRVFSHIWTLLWVGLSWVLFDAVDFSEAFTRIASMFGGNGLPFVTSDTLYYLRSYAVVIVIGLIGATPIVKKAVLWFKGTENSTRAKIMNVIEPVFVVAILLVSTAYIIDGSYNPFLYFRF